MRNSGRSTMKFGWKLGKMRDGFLLGKVQYLTCQGTHGLRAGRLPPGVPAK